MSIAYRVERFLTATGIAATTFGREVARDPRLVFDMRRGRTLGAKLQGRVEARLAGAGL